MRLRTSGHAGVLLAIVAIGASAGACRRTDPAPGGDVQRDAASTRSGAAPPEQPVALGPENVAVVALRTLQAGPEVSGTLKARRAATLRAELGGTVLDVLAEQGQRVKANELLARIDPAALQDQLLAARSGVRSARNALRVAESSSARARTLARAGALSNQDAERADAALEAARAQLADAEARAALAAQQSARTRIRAPFAGVVSERQVSVGDVVSAGTALFTIVDPAHLQFEAAIPAAQLAHVRVGDAVDFTVTGFDGRAFQGRVERVNPTVDPTTGQVRLYVDVPNEGGRLISGLYAQGRIAAQSSETLAAPVAAVDATAEPPSVLRIGVAGRVERVPVQLGLRDEVRGEVGVRGAVKAGDVLVLGSARGAVSEGTRVRVSLEPAPDAAREASEAEPGRSGAPPPTSD